MSKYVYGARITPHKPKLCRPAPPIVGSGFSLPPAAASADLRHLCTYVANQGQTSKCVGEGFAGAAWVATRGAGKRFSETGIYVGARVRERLRQSDPIPDTGSNPSDAADSLVAMGAYPRDSRDDDLSQVDALDSWLETTETQLFQPSDICPIGAGDLATVDSFLSAGFPVVDWMDVDQSFENIADSNVWNGMVGPVLGGHCTVLVGFDSISYWLWNSWGLSWGVNGFARIARNVVASQCGLCAVVGGPVL